MTPPLMWFMLEVVMGCPIKLPHHKFDGEYPPFNKLNYKLMSVTSLQLLAEQAKLAELAAGHEDMTFNISSLETKVSKTQNVGFRVTTDQGQQITFWSSNMDQVVEALDDAGNYQVIPGTRVADDGGLIPFGSKPGGFWK